MTKAMHALNLTEAFCWALLEGLKEGETDGWIEIDGWRSILIAESKLVADLWGRG